MVIVFEGLDAESTALLRAPMRGPDGAAFSVVDMQAELGGRDAYRVSASLALSDNADSTAVADWLWERIEDAAPLVMTVGDTRARVGEPAAIAFLIDRAR